VLEKLEEGRRRRLVPIWEYEFSRVRDEEVAVAATHEDAD